VSRCDEVVVVVVPLDAQAASWASCGGLRRGDAKALGGALYLPAAGYAVFLSSLSLKGGVSRAASWTALACHVGKINISLSCRSPAFAPPETISS
jgi:hypothetical protein